MVPGWDTLGCGDGKGKVLVSTAVYDMSACDIIDEGVDLVYSHGVLYHRHTSLSLWRYWTCVALAIVVVRALSYNVQGLWTNSPQERKQWPPLVCSLGILALVLLDLDSVYISAADQAFFWCSIAYAGFYLLIHGAMRFVPRSDEGRYEQPVFNILVVTLQILAMRLYTGTETPYNLLLIGMLACRAWTKLLTLQNAVKARDGLSLVMDSLYLSLCVELAYSGARELMVAVNGVAFVAAQVLAHHA
jgi:hypothetical protein